MSDKLLKFCSLSPFLSGFSAASGIFIYIRATTESLRVKVARETLSPDGTSYTLAVFQISRGTLKLNVRQNTF